MADQFSLSDAEMPAAFHGADKASLDGQRFALLTVRWSLRCGLLAAIGGAVTWRLGEAKLDAAAAVSAIAFLIAIGLNLLMNSGRYEERWYKGRAIAESVKTLAWRFSVGGDPFPVSMSIDEAAVTMATRVGDIISTADESTVMAEGGSQISEKMRALRSADFETRRKGYIAGRIDDQASWYSGKAKSNRDSRRRWASVLVVCYSIGFLGAAAKFLGWIDLDVLGVAAAAGGGVVAWVQVRQHRVLAQSYSIASQELGLARERLIAVADEDGWALEVSDAEDAISREHTMWLARHGHKSPI